MLYFQTCLSFTGKKFPDRGKKEDEIKPSSLYICCEYIYEILLAEKRKFILVEILPANISAKDFLSCLAFFYVLYKEPSLEWQRYPRDLHI